MSGRAAKIKAVNQLLDEEPEILTFYGSPVSSKQSKVIVFNWIERSQDITYKLQGSTKNSISGNRKMFYHQPSFLYGTDTIYQSW
jgi:hypothetical protein